MKSNTITINLNYNENELQLDMEDLINSIKFVLSNKYKENNIAYEVIDTSLTTISIPSPQYPLNPGPYVPANPSPNDPWHTPFRYEKIGDTPDWWNNQPMCIVNPNTQQYTTPHNITINNYNKKGTK